MTVRRLGSCVVVAGAVLLVSVFLFRYHGNSFNGQKDPLAHKETPRLESGDNDGDGRSKEASRGGGDQEEQDSEGVRKKKERYADELAGLDAGKPPNWRSKYYPVLKYPPVLEQALAKYLLPCHNLDEMIKAYTQLIQSPELEPFLGELYIRLGHLYASQRSWAQCEAFMRLAMSRTSETSFGPDIETRLPVILETRGYGFPDQSCEPYHAAHTDAEQHKAKYPELVSEYALWELAQCYRGQDRAKFESTLDELWNRQGNWHRYGEEDTTYLKERVDRDPWTALSDETYYIRLEDKAACTLIDYYVGTDPTKAIPYEEGLLEKYSALGRENVALIAKLAESYLAGGRTDEARQAAQRGIDALRQFPVLTMYGSEQTKNALASRLEELLKRSSQG